MIPMTCCDSRHLCCLSGFKGAIRRERGHGNVRSVELHMICRGVLEAGKKLKSPRDQTRQSPLGRPTPTFVFSLHRQAEWPMSTDVSLHTESTQLHTGFGALCWLTSVESLVPLIPENLRSLTCLPGLVLSCKNQIFARTLSVSCAAANRLFASLPIPSVAFCSLEILESVFFFQYLH